MVKEKMSNESGLSSDQGNLLAMLHQAGQFQSTGQFEEAEVAYRQVLAVDPENKFALQLLGGMSLQLGKYEQACELIGKTLIADPDNAELNNNLGNALVKLGRLDEALKHLNKALSVAPEYAQAHNNLAAALRELGRLDEALAHHIQALEGQPENPRMRNNYANTLKRLDRTDEALEQYSMAVEQAPDYVDSYYNLGVLQEALNQMEKAQESYSMALEKFPDHPQSNFNLGNILRDMGQSDAAIEHFEKAIAVKPDYAEAHSNLGLVLRLEGKREAAEEHWKQAVEIMPDLADAQVNLGLVSFEKGNLADGWARYEWRDKADSYNSTRRKFPQPQWDGSALKDKEIILWGEQGLGDEILYASMIQDVLKQGGKVTIECTLRLVNLFTRSFPGVQVHAAPYGPAESGQRHFDYQCSFPSLGQHVRKSHEDFPGIDDDHVYLKADPEKMAFWQKRLAELSDKPKIGLNWNSMAVRDGFEHFYASIQDMKPLLTLPGVDFINLVPADVKDDIGDSMQKFGVPIHTWDDLDLKDDVDGVAALMGSLDLVVTCLSAVSELAGAMGLRTLGFIGEKSNTIMLGTDDVVWFPNTHYTAKELDESWQKVFEDIGPKVKEIVDLDE